jgi:hypothetical protein
MCAQIYVGSVIQKSYSRFLGTLIGCLIAVIALVSMGDSSVSIVLTVAIASFIFSYVAIGYEKLTYACTLGGVTTAIIMLGQNPTIGFAAERFLEISLGILIATIISQFVLPIHARTHLRRTQANTLEQLRDFYTGCMVTELANLEKLQYEEIDENIVKLLSKQRALAKEAVREPGAEFFDPELCVSILQIEKEILRSIDFMHHAIVNIKAEILPRTSLQIFNESVVQSFNTLIKVIETNTSSECTIQIPSLKSLKSVTQNNLVTASRENMIYIDGFIFSAEILADSLTKLAKLYSVVILDKTAKKS